MGGLIDLTGQRFGRLTVIERAENAGNGAVRFVCQCDCGRRVAVRSDALRNGTTKSCGCLISESTTSRNVTHKLSRTRLYRTWAGMKQRCYNPKASHYRHYGGRGIKICDEWLYDFRSFYDWAMGNGYQENLSIDRIDNDKGYYPENCRWVPMSVQLGNRSNSLHITVNGQTKELKEWCKQFGVKYHKAYIRIRRDRWTPEEALGLIPRKKS